MSASMFAHQGGWDEILLVVAPLGIIGLLLWVANRRLASQLEQEAAISEVDERDGDSAIGHNDASSQIDEDE